MVQQTFFCKIIFVLFQYENKHDSMGGVKSEFVQNLFGSIRKFAIRLIRKGEKYLKIR